MDTRVLVLGCRVLVFAVVFPGFRASPCKILLCLDVTILSSRLLGNSTS